MGASPNFCKPQGTKQQEILFDIVGSFKYKAGQTFEHFDKKICQQQNYQQKLQNLIDRLAKDKQMYMDPELETHPIILKSNKGEQHKCQWMRVNSIIKGQSKMIQQSYPDQIIVKDQIMQYLGMFLIFLAKNKSLIKEIILTKINTFGLHYIKVKDKQILIDDFILCNQKHYPLFSQPIKNQIWPLIIQKAWLKINGGKLSDIQNLSPKIVFNSFLSIPTYNFTLQNKQNNIQMKQLLNLLESPNNTSYFYIFRAKKFDPDVDQLIGLRDHAEYALLTSFKINQKRYFYLRNPIGQFNYRGQQSLISEQMRLALKQQQINEIKAGNFIVNQNQLFQYFDTITTVFYKQNYNVQFINFDFTTNQDIYFKFQIKKKTSICFRILQQSADPSPFLIDLIWIDKSLSITNGSKNSFSNLQCMDFFDNIMHQFQRGVYLIRLKSRQKKQKSKKKAKLYIYFSNQEKLNLDHQQSNQQQYKKLFNSYLISRGKIQLAQNPHIHKRPTLNYLIKWFTDDNFTANRAVIYIQNITKNRKKQIQQIELQFPNLKNLQCISHRQLQLQTGTLATLSLHDDDILMIVFEKRYINQETSIGEHLIVPA